MAGRPKFQIEEMTLQKLLDLRIENTFNYGKTKGRAKEYIFSKNLYKELKDILTRLNYKVVSISKEFKLLNGICDFLCKLKNNEYLIIECKVGSNREYENNDLKFSFSIGQLLTYRSILSTQYQIDKNKIKLMLATDNDSLLTLNTIATEELDISYLVYEKGGIKYYE